MRLPTQYAPRSPLVRQQPRDDGSHRSVRTREQACSPKCSANEEHLSGKDGTSVPGNRTSEHTIRVIATNLSRQTVLIRAGCNAKAPGVVERRINPKLRQRIYEFQLEEFLETVERTQCADGTQTMKAALEGKDD